MDDRGEDARYPDRVNEFLVWGQPVSKWLTVLPEHLATRLRKRHPWWAYWLVRHGGVEMTRLMSANDYELLDSLYRWMVEHRARGRDPFKGPLEVR